ncbi:MAG: Methyltransferase domain protein [Bacilli bacterium]|nr:Methyltransferase domain protein [Bacilli bacterium]
MQKELSATNKEAWNQSPYEAWTIRYGTPVTAAEKIKGNPVGLLTSLYEWMGDVRGKRVINLLGSHGSKAVALALLGAEVTVVDIASENARYAADLAEAVGVKIHYVVSDVLELKEAELKKNYDIVLMEFGILHYFSDLLPLMNIVSKLLCSGGRLVLQDFHPISTKLISSRGSTQAIRKHKVTGDYFDTSIEEVEVPYHKFLPEQQRNDLLKTRLRKWTLGEVVTSVAAAGLFVEILKEEPNKSSEDYDKGIPKTFTLIAKQL